VPAGAPATAQAPGRRVIDLAGLERSHVDNSPSSVSARLNALRTGIRRGQQSVEAEEEQP
jgi:hypothetical protein